MYWNAIQGSLGFYQLVSSLDFGDDVYGISSLCGARQGKSTSPRSLLGLELERSRHFFAYFFLSFVFAIYSDRDGADAVCIRCGRDWGGRCVWSPL